MLSAVLGLFSQDLAVDLGTSNTRLWLKGAGVAMREPTALAVRTDTNGRREVVALGEEARGMRGRTPSDIETLEPVRHGQVEDWEVAEAYLLHLMRRVHGRNGWMRPRMVIAISHGATEIERRAVRECCERAGAREVHLVPKPIAAALGADLPIDEAAGHLMVDIGGGTTEIGVVSCGGVVAGVTVQGGGNAMDAALCTWLAERHGLLVGQPSAEKLRAAVAAGTPVDRHPVAGRCATRGVPRGVEVDGTEAHHAIAPRIEDIASAILRIVDLVPPELGADVVDHGIVLVGGGSRLVGLDRLLRERTGLAVVIPDAADDVVVAGAGRALEQMDVLERVAC